MEPPWYSGSITTAWIPHFCCVRVAASHVSPRFVPKCKQAKIASTNNSQCVWLVEALNVMASALERGSDDKISDNEKLSTEGVRQEYGNTIATLPDPDAGLSEEERAAHVS